MSLSAQSENFWIHTLITITPFFKATIKNTSIVRNFEIVCVKFNVLRICAYIATYPQSKRKRIQ